MTTEAIDMRSQLPGARDQGTRPTCLAFAISDAHLVSARPPGLLAPEYLHFHAARRSHVSLNAGVGLVSMQKALKLDGQPLEDECPYMTTREESWTPPSSFSAIWTRGSRAVSGKASEVLTTALAEWRMSVLVLRISRSFHAPNPDTHVVLEDSGKDLRRHAVLIVGMASVAGTTAFLARNSWGTGWGQDGYAWLLSSYVDDRASNVVEVEA